MQLTRTVEVYSLAVGLAIFDPLLTRFQRETYGAIHHETSQVLGNFDMPTSLSVAFSMPMNVFNIFLSPDRHLYLPLRYTLATVL